MKQISLRLGLISLILLAVGCSKQTIEGEAFIDAGGSSATKLALVTIQVIPEEQFIAQIKKMIPKAAEEAARLKKSITDFEARDAESTALRMQGDMLRMQAGAMGIGGSIISQNMAVNRRSEELSRDGRSLANKLANAYAGLITGANPLYFSDKFDGVLLSTETNSDGKFKLSLEAGKKVVLVAVKDELAWALWITPEKSKPTITLSNKNLSGSGCSDCVFGDKVTPKLLAGV